ncbi:hypothetical protein P4S64_21265 [Vibrio sp. M60_M31a]
MDKAGVRGVRFNFVKRLVDTAPKETLKQISRKFAHWAGMLLSTLKLRISMKLRHS